MALKRTMQPFYGKKETRLEQEISQVRSRMVAAGASTADISEAIKYGENELAKMRDERREKHIANLNRNQKRFPPQLVHGRAPSKPHAVYHGYAGPNGRQVRNWS